MKIKFINNILITWCRVHRLNLFTHTNNAQCGYVLTFVYTEICDINAMVGAKEFYLYFFCFVVSYYFSICVYCVFEGESLYLFVFLFLIFFLAVSV